VALLKRADQKIKMAWKTFQLHPFFGLGSPPTPPNHPPSQQHARASQSSVSNPTETLDSNTAFQDEELDLSKRVSASLQSEEDLSLLPTDESDIALSLADQLLAYVNTAYHPHHPKTKKKRSPSGSSSVVSSTSSDHERSQNNPTIKAKRKLLGEWAALLNGSSGDNEKENGGNDNDFTTPDDLGIFWDKDGTGLAMEKIKVEGKTTAMLWRLA
jgi:hypothetical protein